MLSPPLCSLYTHDCVARHWSDSIVGQITGNDESVYRREINNLIEWYQDNSLVLNISKTNR